MARALGLSRSQVNRIRAGEQDSVQDRFLDKIATKAGVDPDYLRKGHGFTIESWGSRRPFRATRDQVRAAAAPSDLLKACRHALRLPPADSLEYLSLHLKGYPPEQAHAVIQGLVKVLEHWEDHLNDVHAQSTAEYYDSADSGDP